MLKSLAALVLVTATKSFSSIFPVDCGETTAEIKMKWEKAALSRWWSPYMLAKTQSGNNVYSDTYAACCIRNALKSDHIGGFGGLLYSHPSRLIIYICTLTGVEPSYHSSVPHHRHPLFDPIGSLWDQSEVVFTDGFLSCGEAGLSAGSYLQIATGKKNTRPSDAEVEGEAMLMLIIPTERCSRTNHANREVRYCGVEGSGLRGGLMTKAAAVAQSLDQ